ncbi:MULTISPECIES: hypothetical protein [Acidovorax]|uniref:DUF2946 domain-containing protein n=1 Tax=Acidovorax soli TaxID=592050 RepID=A0A1H3VHW6_9BURK|nr:MULTISPECIES: hypothetical protein [Acidovorax]SDZ74393.1 hypothetical protein SAMN05421875_101173 [Acidovorax soli]
MRRILSLALVVMLVLRGLVGTALAAGVMPTLPVQGAEMQTPAGSAGNHAGHAVHADHGDAHQAAAPASCHGTPATDCSPHQHSPSCADCDVCHSAVLAPPALPLQPLHLRSTVRPANTVPFASVQAARTIKPPIA